MPSSSVCNFEVKQSGVKASHFYVIYMPAVKCVIQKEMRILVRSDF